MLIGRDCRLLITRRSWRRPFSWPALIQTAAPASGRYARQQAGNLAPRLTVILVAERPPTHSRWARPRWAPRAEQIESNFRKRHDKYHDQRQSIKMESTKVTFGIVFAL